MPIRPSPIRYGCACRWLRRLRRGAAGIARCAAPLPAGCGLPALAIAARCSRRAGAIFPVSGAGGRAAVAGDGARRARSRRLLVAALAALVMWIGLAASGEAIMGLKMHDALHGQRGVRLAGAVAAAGHRRRHGAGRFAAVTVAGAGPCGDGGPAAGLQHRGAAAAESASMSSRTARPRGSPSPSAHLPRSLREAAPFSAQPEAAWRCGYAAPAGAANHPAPSATVTRNGDDVTLELHAPGDGVVLQVPQDAQACNR